MTRRASLGLLVVAIVAGCSGAASPAPGLPGPGGGSTAPSGTQVVSVHLTAAGCDPQSLEIAAGPTRFDLVSDGEAAGPEFEIKSGDVVVGEVEDIAPFARPRLVLDLAPGTYALACPGDTSAGATGTLTVRSPASPPVSSAPAGASAKTSANPASGSDGSVAVESYRAYLRQQTAILSSRTRTLVAAVKAGDIARAKALYGWARAPYEAIEPVAERFGDLDPDIDARDGDVPAADWKGFHRIEKALWTEGSTSGIAPIADALVTDTDRLATLIATVDLEPAQIANGSVELLNEVSSSKLTGEEERYSRTDLWDIEANVEGSLAAFEAVSVLVPADQAALTAAIRADFASLAADLDPYRTGDGFVLLTALSTSDTRALATAVDALAERLSQVPALVVGK